MSRIAILFALAACSRSPNGTSTVPYYRAHAAEREAMVRACTDDPGQLRNSGPCVNAREAARLENIGSLRNLPPMGLPGAGKSDETPASGRKE